MDLLDDLTRELGADQVLGRSLDRHVRAHDASHYLLVPEVVAIAPDAAAVARTFATAARHGAPVTLRAGGTSLSGQACGTGVLLDTRRGFRGIEVLDGGARVRVQPGATLRAVNARLAPYGRALGPDPASESACTVGGVVANNSSGMAAGTEHNSYRTVESMTVVLASGTVVDTAAPDAADRLRAAEPGLVATLERLRDRVRHDPGAVAEIAERFAMKNTMGYGINAFCDATDVVDLLRGLVVGSEGTLGFVAEAVFRTVPVQRAAATGLLVLEDVEAAAAALPGLVATGAAALELMDATSLRVAQRAEHVPAALHGLEVDRHAAVLVEYRADDEVQLRGRLTAARPFLDGLPAVVPIELSSDTTVRADLWAVRKGLYAAVAGARPEGTTALLEDVVVPVEHLADTCRELAALLVEHEYVDPVVFGHAKDGNLHFMLTDDLEDPSSVARLEAFTEDLVDLVLRHGGNLKAEHGTGRAMAPFVPRQYSAGLVAVMRELKDAFDPVGILNPGVLLTDDSRAHLADLKPVARVEEEVDRCVECGYCEPVCPSKDLTLTPRQRIVARRARALADAAGDTALVREIDDAYRYDGVETCAADGMCATACPVGIDTGALVKRLRSQDRGRLEQEVWRGTARHWSVLTSAAGAVLDTLRRVPAPWVELPNAAARAVLGHDTVPRWTPDLPGGGRARSRGTGGREVQGRAAAVFLPSCQGALFAPADDGPGVQAALARLCEEAGVGLAVPAGVDGLCCGTPWSSKGYTDGHARMAEHVLQAVSQARDRIGHDVPVVVDASSCTEGVARIMSDARAAGDPRATEVQDAVTFVARDVLPRIAQGRIRPVDSLTLHPTCASTRSGIDHDLRTVADAVARTVHVPVDAGCCGFAGDRGMLHPELTASATAAEAGDVERLDAVEHASCNRACEIAMSRATRRTYRHVLEVAARALDGPG
ncbi:FAD-binding and (Fe-S)-binding domain-containing protein [Isoptericola chiayiensis]|uniref:D-lactate dehydrogenase (cytochrome) n=1 Tax=Isoptericola chiayiensis TaxID=579446 RepID=A0ABP8YPN9_9MICO|nr:D-lactate dehydrogenase [Isoptericola chiayiensis]